MTLKAVLEKLKLEPYVIALFGMVVLASIIPVRGEAAHGLNIVVKLAIALLFFLHGAKLSRENVVAGLTHWRLHLLILAFTFMMFPILGLVISKISILPTTLAAGMLFLCCLPSTVQSSIAFTSMARGNVAAAVVAASASNLFGIFITPLLVSLLMHTQGGASGGWKSVQDIVVQLLLPFIAGQLARPLVSAWINKHKQLIGYVDRGSILLVVYAAFSEAVVGGIWPCAACCWPWCWPPRPSARGLWASRPRTRRPSPSVAPRRAWRPACRWRASCSPARPPASSSCR